jgi:hypothetical protein
MTITIEDGVSTCLLTDDADCPEAASVLGAGPQRASSIEPVSTGKFAGWWSVDFSPLVQLRPGVLAFCLISLFRTRAEAIRAEIDWLEHNFLGIEREE